jgi:hypothetical protein
MLEKLQLYQAMMDCKCNLQIKQNKKTFEPGRNNKMDSMQEKLYPKKGGFVFSAHHAITATKHKPKYTKVTSGVSILKQ